MKKIGNYKKIRKVTVATVIVAMLFSLVMMIFAPVAEASEAPTLEAQASGKFNFGTVGISDPAKINVGAEYYMKPLSYVYLGEVFNSVTKTYETVVCRVLDADRSNNGLEGAMFLYTESAVEPTKFHLGAADKSAEKGTENIYVTSNIYKYGASNFNFRSHYGRHFENVPEEEDYILRVTKNDVKANMIGIYPDFLAGIDYSLYSDLKYHDYIFSFETDTVDPDIYFASVPSDQVLALDNAAVFPLSAEEFYTYMGSMSESETYSSKYVLSGESVPYWLRTGIHEEIDRAIYTAVDPSFLEQMETMVQGSLVTAVDENGKLVAKEAVSEGLYGRYGFNLSTESISYNKIIDGVHKLAFADPRYAVGEDALFDAEIINTDENGVVTFKYTNAICSRSTAWYGDDDENEYVSVIIKDENGNVKSYASVAEVPKCFHARDEEVKSSEYYTATFALPDDYNEEKDTIVIFWERKHDDERRPSFTSNFVELDCAHTYYRENGEAIKLPTCSELGICVICEEAFGEFDPMKHTNIANGEYLHDEETNTHWQICPDCGADGDREECVFPNYCIAPCACGNINEESEHHNYNSDGICERDEGHYEKPKMNVVGNYDITVRVENIGNWLWLANKIASGEKLHAVFESYYVYLDADLDFENEEFLPLGTEENPFKGEINSLGRNFSIKNINYSAPDRDGVGIVAVGENVKIVNIEVRDVTFAGKSSVGALVGKAKEVEVEGVTVVGETDVSATDGTCGAFFGSCDEASLITLSFSYAMKDGMINPLPVSGSGTPKTDTAYFLSDVSADGGYITKEEFASGMVAYSFNQKRPGSGWRQTLGVDGADAYPRRDGAGAYVRITEYCDGTPAVYTNNKKNEMIHCPSEFYGFEWDDTYNYCDADVFCSKCNQRMLMPADVRIIYEYPKVTYIASVMIGDELIESDPVVIFGVKIEDFIGMEALELTYNGGGISPEVLMTNHALHESEYSAYFVNSETGEAYMYEDYYGTPNGYSIYDAGVYDLVVVGCKGNSWIQVGGNWTEDNTVHRAARDFSGQSVTYERVLTVLPAEVTVTPLDVYKTEDGNGKFIPNWIIDNESFSAYDFEVSFSDAPSGAVGDYTLDVTASTDYHGENVILTLAKNKVCGSIIEKRKVEISNKNYPESFVFGDTVPTPKAEDFNITDGAEFSFEWFNSATNYSSSYVHLVPMSGNPVNAGDYVLRVYASPSGELGGSYADVKVTILPRRIEVDFEFSPEVETVEHYSTYYYIDSFDEVTVKLSGFEEGRDAESYGISAKAVMSSASHNGTVYTDPDRMTGYLAFEIIGGNSNFSFEDDPEDGSYLVSLPGVGLPEIIEEEYSYDWDKNYSEKLWGFRYGFSWQMPEVEGFELDFASGEHWLYRMTVYDITNGIGAKVPTGIQNVEVGYLNGSITDYYYSVRTNKAGSYLISFEVTARNYGRNELEIPGTEDNKLRFDYYIDIGINERADGDVDLIEGLGCYTVTVSAYGDLESYENGKADKITSHEFFVAKEIKMEFKEIEYNISDGSFNFDTEDIYKHVVMEAGGVFNLGHELSEVYIDVNTNSGYASVRGFVVKDGKGNDVSYLYKVKPTNHNSADHLEKGAGTAHIFDTPCDPDCNVADCDYRRAVSHKGDASGEGSCLKASVCEICGGAYVPENAKHLSEKLIVRRCGDDLSLHELVYACCGAVSSREAHYSSLGATCKTLAKCDGCARSYGELDPDNHENEAGYEALGEDGHSVSYPCCGHSYSEAHFGGVATCKSAAICEGCGAGYGSTDPDNHVGKIEAAIDPDDPDLHIKSYDCCNVSVSEPHSGGEATCILRAVCEDCNASYGETNSEKHTSPSITAVVREDNASMHDAYHSCCNEYIGKFYHTGGTASCSGGAICTDCGSEYGDANLENHKSKEYKFVPSESDPTIHIKVYACCGEECGTAPHTFGEANCVNGATCSDCGYADGNLSAHQYANSCTSVCSVCGEHTRAVSFHTDAGGNGTCDFCGAEMEKDGISGGAVSAIVTGSTVAVGAGGFSLFWFIIKKKSLLELLAFFK